MEVIPHQVSQLFSNLISNALKFSVSETLPVITITAKMLGASEIKNYPELDHKLKFYEIIFKDNGIGFDPKFHKQIFTIFQKLHKPTIYSGTGIGLAISKKIVENHHGEIFAVSHDNHGAEFHIIIPVKQHKIPVKSAESAL